MIRRYSRRRLFALGAGLAGAALVGCGGDEPATASPTATPDRRIRVRVASSEGDVSPGGGFSVGVLASTVGADGLDALSRTVAYSRLVGFDPRTAAIYSDLAEEVELPEPLTVRLRLRDGVHFHPDGSGNARPLTAEEVARDFAARRDEGVFLFTDVIDRVETPTSSDVVLHLRAPFSLLFEYLARTDASIRGVGDYGGLRAPLGSGPFLPTRRDGDDLVLRPNPLLDEDARPRASQLRVRRAERDGDLDAMFVRGLLDAREHPDSRSRDVSRGRAGRIEVSRPRQRMRGLALSLLAPRDQAARDVVEALRDSRVRRACSLALDRRNLADVDDSLLAGPVGPAFAGDALPAVELEAHPLYQHDPGEAVKLLAAAGYPDLNLRLTHSDSPLMLGLSQVVGDQLSQAGIRVRLSGRPAAGFESAFLAGDFEAAFVELDGLESPDIGLRLHTSGGVDGTRSPWGYSNPVYDARVQEALGQIDPAMRTRLSREAQRMLLDDVPAMLPLNAPLGYASVGAGVSGYEFDAYGFNPGMLARFWHVGTGEEGAPAS